MSWWVRVPSLGLLYLWVTDSRRREREFVHLFSRAVRLHQFGLGSMVAAACQSCQGFRPEKKKVYKVCHRMQSPYRLVVRTSCRGRDNPGSTPGGDTARIYAEAGRQVQWSSGRIHRCHRCDPGTIAG